MASFAPKLLKAGAALDLTTTASSATALPTPTSGIIKKVRVEVSAAAYLLFGLSTVTATTSSMLMTASGGEIFDVAGLSHFSARTVTGTGVIVVSPVEE